MKKRMLAVLCGIVIIGGMSLGGFFAYAAEWFIVGDNGVMVYQTIDQARIDVYSDVTHERSRENGQWVSALKPEHLVKSVKDMQGNEVDFSELDVSYQVYDYIAGTLKDVPETEALNGNGTFNFDRFKEYRVTYTYTYDATYKSGYSTIESTISKMVIAYEGVN